MEEGNKLVCSYCKKTKLLLKSVNEDLRIGVKKDGKRYTVRKDRRRYFFPHEWNKFYATLKNDKHKILFLTLLHTGARIMEALHIRPKDINFERETITLEVTKNRSAKRNIYAMGAKRSFFVSKKYLKELKKYIKKYNIKDEEYFFLDNDKLPENYIDLPNKEKLKYFGNKSISYRELLKRKMKKTGIKDWYNFSLHNLRKTYGNWIKTFDIRTAELCYRMGHDLDTYLTHYGSPMIFTAQERIEIMKILGEIK